MIISMSEKRKDKMSKKAMERFSQAERIRKLEGQVQHLAELLHDVSADGEETRKILRQLLSALKAEKN